MIKLIRHGQLKRISYLKSAVCQVDVENITLISLTESDMTH